MYSYQEVPSLYPLDLSLKSRVNKELTSSRRFCLMNELIFFLLRESCSLVSLGNGGKSSPGTCTAYLGVLNCSQSEVKETHPHNNAHALALIGEREDLQDGEVQDLVARGPQLHGRLVSAHQG